MDLGEIYKHLDEWNSQKKKENKDYRNTHNIKCGNCNRKIVAINNDFKVRKECKTCYMGNCYERALRKNKY
jgi:hypothetical protein